MEDEEDYGDDFEEVEEEVVEEEDEEEVVQEAIEPPQLDQPVYHEGETVEVRSPGRHGWHGATVSGVDFGQSALTDSAVGTYSVTRELVSHEAVCRDALYC